MLITLSPFQRINLEVFLGSHRGESTKGSTAARMAAAVMDQLETSAFYRSQHLIEKNGNVEWKDRRFSDLESDEIDFTEDRLRYIFTALDEGIGANELRPIDLKWAIPLRDRISRDIENPALKRQPASVKKRA